MRGLKGKVAAVTGAGSGIGQAAAQRLGEEGCKVAVLDRNAEGARQTVESIVRDGGDAIAITVDVSDEAGVEAAFKEIVAHYGKLDIVCSNAGIFYPTRDGKVADVPLAIWEEIVGVNLTGMFLTCKHGIAAIRATAGTGAVVLTGSPTGIYGCTPGSSAYSSSKGGVHGLARVMAVDYASEGIRVNVMIPGHTLSPLVAEMALDEAYQSFVKTIPFKRGAQPEEIAGAIAFMASDDASYMTGSLLVVDSGLTAV